MAKNISDIISPSRMNLGNGFKALSLDLERERDYTYPVVHLDHFRMKAPTFAPHPHAGFSAISYIFADSKGSIRNRDSLGNDFEVSPGGIVWTQAGSGIVHDELPTASNKEVHGLQIFVNSAHSNRELPPQVMYANGDGIPVVKEKSSIVRVAVGNFLGEVSPVAPLEDRLLLDIELHDEITIPVRGGWNAVVYLAKGNATVRSSHNQVTEIEEGAAIGYDGGAEMHIEATSGQCQVVILAGEKITDSYVRRGPFIQNSMEDIESALYRYQTGQMGRLLPLQ